MKTVKVSDLSGPALDWAVAKCEGVELSQAPLAYQIDIHGCLRRSPGIDWRPSRDWSLAGPIMDRGGVESRYRGQWQASPCFDNPAVYVFSGPTRLVAAMRCHVACHLGDTVEIPEELL